MVLFQKTWWKRVKEYSFNFFTERDIVEDCVAVILPPQLTLEHHFSNYNSYHGYDDDDDDDESDFARKSRLTKFLQKSSNFFRNSRHFFHMFLRPQCTFATNSYMSFITETPSKMVLFQKTWWKRGKENSFNLFIERVIVEDCVAVILPPQLTL